jgi:cyanophycinase
MDGGSESLMRLAFLSLIALSLVPSLIFAQGSVLLVGGGSENYNDWSDVPYRWLVNHASNRKIAVLHYGDTTTFFSSYFPWLSACTVSNRQITSTAQANDSATYRFVLEHDGIFLRGGDQAQYIRLWKGTLTQQAIKEVFLRGGVVGGTSAGEMILGDVAYTSGNTDNGAILRAPTSSITLVDDFLRLVPGILAESHTSERGRLGRLPVFLARYREANGRAVIGVGIDANTALAIEPNMVGLVMGASAVALLRWKSGTSYAIEAGKGFSLRDMMFDQVLPGSSIDLRTGEILTSATAAAFTPMQVSTPRGPVLLDGSGNANDWTAGTGSLKRFVAALTHANDTVGIFSSPGVQSAASSLVATLDTWGTPSRIFWVNGVQQDDPDLSTAAGRCAGFLFVGCIPDSVTRFLDPSTRMGEMFASRVEGGSPLLFLSEDVMLAGEKVLGNIYGSYSAYYGTLSQLPGLNLLKGMQLVPRLYQNPDNSSGYTYSESRTMGMFWSMARSRLPFGMLIDAGTHVSIANGVIEVGDISPASTPVLFFDCSQVRTIDYPTFHRPGKPNAVQNAALVGGCLHVLRKGDSFGLITGVVPHIDPIPSLIMLDQNYPNPFNPVTEVSYQLPSLRAGSQAASKVRIIVYDLLGRELKVLVDEWKEAGKYTVRFDASGLSSGVYLYRLTAGGRTLTRKMSVVK